MRWVVCAVCIALGACSFSGVGRRVVGASGRMECHADAAVPVLDTVVGLAGLGAASILLIQSQSEDELSAYMGQVFAVPLGVGGAISIASAVYGYSAVSKCRREERES